MESSTNYTTVRPQFAMYPPSNCQSSSDSYALDSAMLIPLPDDADDGLQPIDVTEIDNTMTVETVVPTVVMTSKEEQIDAKRKFAKKFLNDCKTALAEYERKNGEIILPLHYSESIQTAASLKLIPVSDPVVTNEQESIDSFQNWATANHMFD